MVRLEGKQVELRPIAGTRSGGKTGEEDLALEKGSSGRREGEGRTYHAG